MTAKGLYCIYLLSAFLFIFAIHALAKPRTAYKGNNLAVLGMGMACLITILVLPSRNDFGILTAALLAAISGIFLAGKIKITALPQMIALLNGFGGLSSVLVGFAQMLKQNAYAFDISAGIIIGGIAFSGSMVAFLKLQNFYRLKRLPFFNLLNFLIFIALMLMWLEFHETQTLRVAVMLAFIALVFGISLTMPVGGADMPIVISVLNALSGFAASFIGFSLFNIALIITGALVGASGTLLALFMTHAMNRNLFAVLFKNTPQDTHNQNDAHKTPKTSSIQDAAFMMQNAGKVIIVPGYGMAASGAQHALKNMASVLSNKYHVNVKFAIHPVAGRMPGHMNVLLAEAKVDYANVFGLDEINPDFETADVAYVIGANDITNPLAQTDKSSPLYGMPILEVFKAKTVFFVKRSLSSGYSGTPNPLFFEDNTLMLYGDAKKITEEITAEL